MVLRFRKSTRILPGVWLNLGKRSTSISMGVRGARMTLSKKGTRTTVGLPGTGLSFTEFTPHRSKIRPPKGFCAGIDEAKHNGRHMLDMLSQHAIAVRNSEGVISREDALAAIEAGRRALTSALKLVATAERTFKPLDAGVERPKLIARNRLKALSQHAIVVRKGEAELSRDDSLAALEACHGAITEALELIANVERIAGRARRNVGSPKSKIEFAGEVVASNDTANQPGSGTSVLQTLVSNRGSVLAELFRWLRLRRVRSPKSEIDPKQPSNSPAKPIPRTERVGGTLSLRRFGMRLAIASFILFGLAVLAQAQTDQEVQTILTATLVIFLYFGPLFVAFLLKHRNIAGIGVLNLFLGWTLIGWVAALIWAFTATHEQGSADAAVDSAPGGEAPVTPGSDGQKSWPWWL